MSEQMTHEHATKLAQHDAAIDSLSKGQDELRTDIHNLDTKFDAGFARIFGKLDTMAASTRPDVKGVLLGIVALCSVLLAMLGLFVKLTVDPIKDTITKQSDKLMDLQDSIAENSISIAYHKGSTIKADEWHNSWLVNLDKHTDEIRHKAESGNTEASALRAKVQAIEEHLKNVDNLGSRKWNASDRNASTE